MGRIRFRAVLIAAASMAVAYPAVAQFGSIFGGDPPRPPASVPRGTQQPLPQPRDTEPGGLLPPGPPPSSRARPQAQPLPPVGEPALLPPLQQPAGRTPQQSQPQTANPLPGLPPGQRQPRGSGPQPGDEVVTEAPAQKIRNPTAVFAGLDKITGRIISFDVAMDETVQFGALQVTPRVCYSRPPTETQQTDSFVEVDEVTLQGEVKRIFGGWMFAASPGLHAVEHPIYDVWLSNCKGGATAVAATPPAADPAPAAPAARPPAQRRQQPAQPRAQQQQQFQTLQPGNPSTFQTPARR